MTFLPPDLDADRPAGLGDERLAAERSPLHEPDSCDSDAKEAGELLTLTA